MDGERAGRNAPPAEGQTSLPPTRPAPVYTGSKPTAMNAAAERFAAHLHLPPQAPPSSQSAEEQAIHLEQRAIELRHAERALNTRATQTRPHRPRTRTAAAAPGGALPAEPAAVQPAAAEPAAALPGEAEAPASPCARTTRTPAITDHPAAVARSASKPPAAEPSPCIRTSEAPLTPGTPTAPEPDDIELDDSFTTVVTLVCTCVHPSLCTCVPEDQVCTCVDPSLCTCVPEEQVCTCIVSGPCTCALGSSAIAAAVAAPETPTLAVAPALPVAPTPPPVPTPPPAPTPETTELPAAARLSTPSQAVADVLSDSPFVPWPRKVTWAGLGVLVAAAAAAAPLSRNRQWRPVCPEHLSECLSTAQATWMNVLWACGWMGLAIIVAGVITTSWWLYKIASSATRPAVSDAPQFALVGGVTWLLHTVLVYLTVPFAYMGWLVSNIGLAAASTAAALAHGLLLERTLKSDIIRLSPGSAHTLAAATTVSTAVLGWLLTSRGFPLWLLAPVAGLCFAGAALLAHHGTHATTRPSWANRTYLLRGTVAAAFAALALAGPVLWWMTGTSGRLIGAPGWSSNHSSVAQPGPSVTVPAPGTPSTTSSTPPAPGSSAPCPPTALSMTTTTWDTSGAQHSVIVTVRNVSTTPCSIAATPSASVKITGRRSPVASSAAASTARIELAPGATRATTLSWAPAVSGTMSTQYLYLSVGPQPQPLPVRLNRWPHPFDVIVGTKLSATAWR